MNPVKEPKVVNPVQDPETVNVKHGVAKTLKEEQKGEMPKSDGDGYAHLEAPPVLSPPPSLFELFDQLSTEVSEPRRAGSIH